jgi:hypothetical protein
MAFNGSAAPVKKGMQDRIGTNVARDGAAKRTQTSFPTKTGMRSRIGEVTGVSGSGPGAAPDASSPNPMDPSPQSKKFSPAPTKSGMRSRISGGGVDHALGAAVLKDATGLGK